MTTATTRSRQLVREFPQTLVSIGEVVGSSDEGLVQVRSGDAPAPVETARLAVLHYQPSAGDQVVLLRDSVSPPMVIGVLERPQPRLLRTAGGTSAAVEGDSIVVRNGAGTPVLSFSDSTGLELRASEGDLVLAAPNGAVRIQAGTALDFDGTERIRMRTATAELQAERVAVESTEATLAADRAQATAADMTVLAGRWELRAQRLVEAAVDAYREIEGLSQCRAGRVRTLVEGAYQLLARRSEIVSEDDTVVDGKRVLLG